MSKQGRIHNFKERFGKPFRKRQKLGEDEDEWCDALNYLSLDSDDEYFDALEEQVPSQSLHTGTKRKKSGRKPSPKKESEMSRHSAQCSKPYTSGLGSKTTIYQPRQGSQLPSNSGVFRFGLQDSSTSTPKNTNHLGDEGYNTASSFSSESDNQAGFKWSPTMSGYADKGKFEKRKVTITLMTSWHLSSIEGLKKKLMTLQRDRHDLIEAVKVLQLPFSGLKRYAFTEDVDIMILCHSIVNRRLSITNVTDSLYDEFLNYCNKKLGKERIAVVAHDFQKEVDEVRTVRMETFKHTQWSTFEKAGLVITCGTMDKTPEIQEKDWKSLVKFLEDASKSTPTIADISQTTHLKKGTSDTIRKPFESEKDKKNSNISSKSLGKSSSRADGMKTRSRKPVIYICTSYGLYSIRGLKEKLKTLLEKSFSRYEIKEQDLLYSRPEDFKFPPEVDRTDAMILCHSVQNRGFSITDVDNSIYDEFLRYCNRVFGKDHLAVIVHDFEDKPEILKIRMEQFHRTQPTTYELADCVAVAGQLINVPDVQLFHDNSTSLETFVGRLL